jgi:2-C-methyl-D-erythritol 2,4-cyclodiphosphate synthase/2-C-methyl-D-erythritol 4-phosphate cytidylyltransferase/2-C-methyl-D-erythritol 2,4-cyclodiphosphate synthase
MNRNFNSDVLGGAHSRKRIGLGRDLHRLVEGRPFILGGVTIPCGFGEDGHSDGDALTHAIIDALLGAAAFGDIGELFPNTDEKYLGASSIEMLKKTWDRLQSEGWNIVNIDCVVSAEKPSVLPYRTQIRRSLADALGIGIGQVFVKGKTGEGIGDIGLGRAVEALAVCMLEFTKE